MNLDLKKAPCKSALTFLELHADKAGCAKNCKEEERVICMKCSDECLGSFGCVYVSFIVKVVKGLSHEKLEMVFLRRCTK